MHCEPTLGLQKGKLHFGSSFKQQYGCSQGGHQWVVLSYPELVSAARVYEGVVSASLETVGTFWFRRAFLQTVGNETFLLQQQQLGWSLSFWSSKGSVGALSGARWRMALPGYPPQLAGWAVASGWRCFSNRSPQVRGPLPAPQGSPLHRGGMTGPERDVPDPASCGGHAPGPHCVPLLGPVAANCHGYPELPV